MRTRQRRTRVKRRVKGGTRRMKGLSRKRRSRSKKIEGKTKRRRQSHIGGNIEKGLKRIFGIKGSNAGILGKTPDYYESRRGLEAAVAALSIGKYPTYPDPLADARGEKNLTLTEKALKILNS